MSSTGLRPTTNSTSNNPYLALPIDTLKFVIYLWRSWNFKSVASSMIMCFTLCVFVSDRDRDSVGNGARVYYRKVSVIVLFPSTGMAAITALSLPVCPTEAWAHEVQYWGKKAAGAFMSLNTMM